MVQRAIVKNRKIEVPADDQFAEGAEVYVDLIPSHVQASPAYSMARAVSHSMFPILILSGTQALSLLLALFIHQESNRTKNRFVPVECRALSVQELLKLTHDANAGTLFLQSVSDMPHSTQLELLRIIGNGGANSARIIAWEPSELSVAVKQGGFREDLFYRLCVCPIQLSEFSETVSTASPNIPNAGNSLRERLLGLAQWSETQATMLPHDLAENHDHYLHGLPKRN